MWERLDITEFLRWLLGNDLVVDRLQSPSDALMLAMGVILLLTAAMLLVARRDKSKRDDRTRQMIEDERALYRWRRM